MNGNGTKGGARARARQAMRAQVAEIAVGLMLEHGYEETTVDDICAAAEISRSTFFRYFPAKEDTLLTAHNDNGELLRAALAARPPTEPPWIAMRRAVDPVLAQYDTTDERIRRLARLILTTPALAAHNRDKHTHWHALLRPEMARRLGADPADPTDPRPDAVIAAALSCVDAALTAWLAGNHTRPLPELVDEAMRVIG